MPNATLAAMSQSAPLEALVQSCVLKNTPPESFHFPAETIFFDVDDAPENDTLAELEAAVQSGARRVVPFVSLEIAGRIQRDYPGLSRSLVFSPERLQFHSVSAIMGETMLNQRHVLASWASLPDRAADLARAFGPTLFIRPNSATKSFTGFSVAADQLRAEHGALSQTEHVPADELCVIAPAQSLPPIEWRFWVVDGRPVTCAPYRWDEPATTPAETETTPPEELQDFARTAASRTEVIESALVLDVVMSDSGPRVVELNPLSTSGFYPGMDLKALLTALADIFV